ncbi:Gfo/Idh/MocA family oxidoreductase [Pedobacter miscanthi]|uniref:Gfo/Idh/MocA family protein n=1 Tax=Pedobacter miscanthi TaxID=2259170 RepID=UPI0029308769|nr:Gfo/Idh/MocA family oxidoreductase [Pedobacter miscanthi]
MLKILIIGLGSIAKKHIDALKALNVESKIYALRSQKGASIIDGVINVYDLDNFDREIDFAIISNPTHLHSFYINSLANKNIPLFIEKPPLSTLAEADELVKNINKIGLKTYVACNLRFHPCVSFVKNYIDSSNKKRINEVNVYCGSYLPEWRPSVDYKQVYSANKVMGGGVHLDLFHEIDYVKWFFDIPLNGSCIKRNKSSLDIDAYDYANYSLEYANFCVNIVLNYYRKDAKRSLEILFEDETWQVDLLQNKITSSLHGLIYQPSDFTILQTYKSQMQYFIDCLMNNQMPMNTFEESLETLKVCLINE